MKIREEEPSDFPAIEALLQQVFGSTYEAALVRRLRSDALVAIALIAEDEKDIVGHIVLSWLPTKIDGRPIRAVALAPMAVRPDRQRRGIGTALVRDALRIAALAGAGAAIVLGHPTYYSRFGFCAGLAAKISSPFTGAAFMALELKPGALSGAAGSVAYPEAFDIKSTIPR
jgi:putative acetyltransferase